MDSRSEDERKQTGWRIPVKLRDRLASWARGEGRNAEDVAAEWLEDRVTAEEIKKARKLLKGRG